MIPDLFQMEVIRGIVEATFCDEDASPVDGMLPLRVSRLTKILTDLECRTNIDCVRKQNLQDHIRQFGEKLWKQRSGAKPRRRRWRPR